MSGDTNPTPDNVRYLHPRSHRVVEPEQLSFDDDWIDYWRNYTRTWAPLNRDQIDAIAAIVARIDHRRAAAALDNDSPQQRPRAA
ncbi:hypothetical protein [Nocardia xishanensis]|uniref:Uncharacterized protein n=1 Tax=Nocardia xishanensis TaxID=238964 RepID=A0ABW7WW60_9NOCA